MQQLSDVELAQQAQDGNVEAVGLLYDRHQARIFRFVRARIYDNALAQDLTGEIFLRMVTHLPTYRPLGVPFTAWLYSMARNHLANHIQKEESRRLAFLHYTGNGSHTAVNPTRIVEQQLELEMVLAALAQLEADQRDVLTLRFLVGLSLQEVADALHKSVAAVKSIQHRGLKMMRILAPQTEAYR